MSEQQVEDQQMTSQSQNEQLQNQASTNNNNNLQNPSPPAPPNSSEVVPSIKKLDDSTINKIAAGEVVIAPSAALKELIENSIDAGSTQINVLCQQGGLNLLQIQDDGHGIKKEDFRILCERFTTSKIEKFGDLKSVASFGFRGEALASISYVSHLTITSKIPGSELAYTSGFQNGIMVEIEGEEAPRPCAGHKGTVIQARDLFYNAPQRKQSMHANEEYLKIVDVVSKYSIHYPMIKFTCKRVEDKRTDVSTFAVQRPNLDKIEDPAEFFKKLNEVRIELIKRQFGQQQSGRDLYQIIHQWDILEMGANLIMSKPNTVQYKKNFFFLFINNRLVDNDRIKRTIDSLYNMFQPKGGYSYFVYFALSVRPDLIDVNVHPTKKQVIFERQDELCEQLQEVLEGKLQDIIGNREFQIDNIHQKPQKDSIKQLQQKNQTQDQNQNNDNGKVQYEHTRVKDPQGLRNMNAIKAVRTDCRATTLDKYFVSGNQQLRKDIARIQSKNPKMVVPQKLMSIRKLIHRYENDTDEQLQKLFKKHSYVGMISPDQVLIQLETKLVLVQVYPLLQEYMYQMILTNFQSMRKFVLYKPLPLRDLLELALDHPDAHYNPAIHLPKQEMVDYYFRKLITKAEMLLDYFSIEFDQESGSLVSLPIVHEIIKPFPQELPMFILRMASEIDYTNEEKCFNGIAEEISHYYAKFIDFHSYNIQIQEGEKDEQTQKIVDELKFSYEHVLFPELKQQFFMRARFAEEQDMSLTMITCTENLYKVFERC